MMLAELLHEPPLPLCHDQSFSAQIPAAYLIFIHKKLSLLTSKSGSVSGAKPEVQGVTISAQKCGHHLFATGAGTKFSCKRGCGGLNTSGIHLQLSGRNWNQGPW